VRTVTASVLAALAVGGCAGDGAVSAELPAKVAYASLHCSAGGGPAVRRIADAAALHAAIGRGHVLDEPGPRVELPAPEVATLWQVDMGERPTAGYTLAVTRVEQHNRSLVVHVDWQEPLPGAIVAQVVTHPCAIIRLPPLQVEEVRVVDQSGRARITQRVAR
jgi:hypothetical protein